MPRTGPIRTDGDQPGEARSKDGIGNVLVKRHLLDAELLGDVLREGLLVHDEVQGLGLDEVLGHVPDTVMSGCSSGSQVFLCRPSAVIANRV